MVIKLIKDIFFILMSRKITNEIFAKELAIQYPNLIPMEEYKGDKTEITVKCIKHNYEFKTKPNTLKHGSGCKFCGREKLSEKKRKDISQVLSDFNKIHNNKYQYPYLKDEYINNKSIITFICPIHGELSQQALKHLNGEGCKLCSHQSFPHTTETYIKRANEIHHNKYDYVNTKYIDRLTDIVITCPIHGDFTQSPKDHLSGCGCPICKESTLEKEIRNILETNSIDYLYEYKGHTLHNKSVDFYLINYNVAIECQGEQHFIPINFFGGENKLKTYIDRDISKYNELLSKHDRIIYVYHKKFKNIALGTKFIGIYENNTLFIEDILEKPSILIDAIAKPN